MSQPPHLSSEYESAKNALSWFRFRAALDERVRSNRPVLQFLFTHRFWLVLGSCATFFIPVLENDNTACLNWSQSSSLTGFDILVPVSTRINLFSGIATSRSVSIHPLGVMIYLPLAIHLYFLFVRHAVPLRWTLWQTVVQTVSTLLLPFTHIALLTFVLPGFRSTWHFQPPLLGFWILLICGIALLAASYHELIGVHEAEQSVTPPDDKV